MKYKKIVKLIAQQHNVSTKEVDSQMRSALKESGINISPEAFIRIAVKQLEKDYLS